MAFDSPVVRNVDDPEIAELLTPEVSEYPLFAMRPDLAREVGDKLPLHLSQSSSPVTILCCNAAR